MYYENTNKTKVVKAILFGALIGILLCTCLTVIATIIVVKMKSIPTDYINIISIIFCVISAFFSGFIAVRIAKSKGMLYGALTAMLLYLILLIAGLCVNSGSLSFVSLTKLISMVIAGGIGGIFAVNKKQKIR